MTARRDILLLTFLSTLVAVAAALTRPHYYAFDPEMYVKFAHYYTDTWQFFTPEIYDQSPPLRYLPYAVLYAVFDPDRPFDFQIAATYAGLATYLGGTLTSYYLGTTLGDRWTGWLAVACFAVATFGWPGARFLAGGKWQYSTTLPFVFAALATAHHAHKSNSRRYAVLTGVLLGMTGLQQLIYAGLASLAIGISFAWQRDWRALALTGSVGALLGSPLLVSTQEAQRRATAGVLNKLTPDTGSLLYSAPKLVGVVVVPGVLVLVALLAGYVSLRRRHGQSTSASRVVEAFIGVWFAAWAVSKLTRMEDYLAVAVLHPVVIVCLFGIGFHAYRIAQERRWGETSRVRRLVRS